MCLVSVNMVIDSNKKTEAPGDDNLESLTALRHSPCFNDT